jgi:nitrate/TMAO reductase-like tetraheme cytochrome c subunit
VTGTSPATPTAFGLSHGQRPLSIGSAPDGARSNQAAECGRCHRQAHRDWTTSRHAVAWTNPVFRQGFGLEPQRFCVHCHAPAGEQFSEVRAARAGDTRGTPFADEGVTCAVCHVRDGRVLGTKGGVFGPHSPVADANVASATLCGSCHQFNFHELRNGLLVPTDEPMQNTYQEWRAYRAAGGKGDCVSCHMPDGRHSFVGSHDVEVLRGALEVGVERRDAGLELSLSSRGVGHHFPTGDMFRHLAVEVDCGAGFVAVERLGREYESAARPDGAGHRQVLVRDTALRPNETRRVVLPEGALRYRVRYFYALERHLLLGNAAQSELVVTLFEGTAAVSDDRAGGLFEGSVSRAGIEASIMADDAPDLE